jgi:hypothetical protein
MIGTLLAVLIVYRIVRTRLFALVVMAALIYAAV